jgi:nicotinate-nucleotide--dimethylbenzimidazole phosphoribosyltransferase
MQQRLFNAQEALLLEEIIVSRRDVRGNYFLPTEIPGDVIYKILYAALNGPSVGFSQPWEFVLVKKAQMKQKIRDSFDLENTSAAGMFTGEKANQYAGMKLEGILEAPLNIAVFYRPSKSAVLGQTSMNEVGLYSVVCAIQNMWLMGRALNVGIGWVSILDPLKVKTLLNAPAENQLVAYLCLGYVKEFLEKPELELLEWEKKKHLSQVLIHENYAIKKMKKYTIDPLSRTLDAAISRKVDLKTKPTGALGMLEEIAIQIARIQKTTDPVLKKPVIVVFAGDHGIVEEGVSAYPQEVTYQMVMNFLSGGAAINVFCRQNGIDLNIVDAGVNYDFPSGLAGLSSCKTGKGTKNFVSGPAMSLDELQKAMESGSKIIRDLYNQGSNIVGFGEMGIGNTTSASALMSIICDLPPVECVGKGTGVDSAGLQKKIAALEKAFVHHGRVHTPSEALARFGGYEIAQICGGMLQAAELGMVVLVDGFIATAAFLVASSMEPAIREYAIFCHQSGEQGHSKMLEHLHARPLLSLAMRLGEGTGAAIAYPVIKSAVAFLNDMASFETAGISNKDELNADQ